MGNNSSKKEIPLPGVDSVKPPAWASKITNPTVCFFDIDIDGNPIGR
jgi:hypothetical protein